MAEKLGLKFSEKIYGQIQELYFRRLSGWDSKKEEVQNFLERNYLCREEELCMKFLYSCAPVQDLLSFSPEWFFLQVRQALKVAENLLFTQQIPGIMWLRYVLMYRINDETPDLSRKILYQELFPLVKGKPAREAALAVNEWCCSRVSYEPTDNRTLGVEGILKRGAGRCGEESTLVTAALRSVGIPARQCYAVKWAHCDDNHAWAEVWTGDGWHYMGACEPEPDLDRGWFTSAASRAMMIRTRSWSLLPNQTEEEEETKPAGKLFSWINVTGRYGRTGMLRVKVTDRGRGKSGVQVKFFVVNYSRLSVIYQGTTDDSGMISCKFGLGELYAEAWDGRKLCGKKVSLQNAAQGGVEIHLELEEGYCPEHEENNVHFSLRPPEEKIFYEVEPAGDFQYRLLQLDRQRAERRENWRICKTVGNKARGNWEEILKFQEFKEFQEEEKHLLLSILNEKDLSDCTADGLKELLESALPYRDRYPAEVWADGVLNPRVSREFLWPVRKQLSEELRKTGIEFSDFRQVQEYLEGNLRILDAGGFDGWTGNPLEMLKQKTAVRSDVQVLLINCCRSLGIAVRYSENLGMAEIWENGEWIPADRKQRICKVILKSRELIEYGTQAAVSIWEEGSFRAQEKVETEEGKDCVVRVRAGFCRILTSRRQIDGEVSCRMRDTKVQNDTEIFLSLAKDKTMEKRKKEAVTSPGKKRIVVFADPGKEPTEHLLQELLQIQEELKENQIETHILLEEGADHKQETLLRILKELWHAERKDKNDYPPAARLRLRMGVGDRRLPFVLAVDEEGMGRFAFANYQIGTASALLNILRG